MDLYAYSALQISTQSLPGQSAVIRMADSVEQLVEIRDKANVVAQLDLVFNDTGTDFGIVRAPTEADARRILEFAQAAINVPNLIAQCQAGVGRSQAVIAALGELRGQDVREVLRRGTYNRRLHDLLLVTAGRELEPQPLVSLAVRVKYAPDRLLMFLLSMRRQRHANWEVVAVTDGPNPEAKKLVSEFADPRVRLIETGQPLGRWGHPYRALGLNACQGDFIGMSNDDNYYVPGYLEQMLGAIEDAGAAIAMCQALHSYTGWAVQTPCPDLGCWIAKRELVWQVQWPGNDFTSDQVFLHEMLRLAGGPPALVPRPLFVHN